MTEQTRSKFLARAHRRAYAGLRYYMRSLYCFGDEDWDKELQYLEGSYMYSVWNRLYDAIFNTRPRFPRHAPMTRGETIAQIKKYGLPPYYELEKPISQEDFDYLISMYFETKLTLKDVVKSAIEDYYKDKVSYTMLLLTCKKLLAKILEENNVLFKIDIATFNPDKFIGHVALENATSANHKYPTTLETVVEDTIAAIRKLRSEESV